MRNLFSVYCDDEHLRITEYSVLLGYVVASE